MKYLTACCLLVAFAAPAAAEDGNPQVALETSKGQIVIELFAKEAPGTVENFLAYVKSGFYDGTIFHRVIADFMVQGGGFGTDLKKKDTREPIKNEADNGLKNDRGTLAMARTGDPHSATAQFFVNVVNNDYLNHTAKSGRGWGYTVFAKVTGGMEVVDAIAAVQTAPKSGQQNLPVETVMITEASVVEPQG